MRKTDPTPLLLLPDLHPDQLASVGCIQALLPAGTGKEMSVAAGKALKEPAACPPCASVSPSAEVVAELPWVPAVRWGLCLVPLGKAHPKACPGTHSAQSMQGARSLSPALISSLACVHPPQGAAFAALAVPSRAQLCTSPAAPQVSFSWP